MDPYYYLDEGLSSRLVTRLRGLGFQCGNFERQTSDEVSIEEIGRNHGRLGVWVSRDLDAKREQQDRIVNAGISVAWIRDENGTPAKHQFLVYNFLYRYRNVLVNATSPLYFEVWERMTNGIPNAVVSKVEL